MLVLDTSLLLRLLELEETAPVGDRRSALEEIDKDGQVHKTVGATSASPHFLHVFSGIFPLSLQVRFFSW